MKKTFILLSMLACAASLTIAQTVKHKPVAKKGVTLAASIASGKKIYMQYCVTCHQADGAGVPNMNPPLIKTSYILGDKIKLIQIVLKGFNEDVEINGQTYSNNMPSHDFLKDNEVADVLTYVRNNFTNKASRVRTSEVTPVRAALKKHA